MGKQNENALIVFCRTPNIVRDDTHVHFSALPWDDIDALFTAFIHDLLAVVSHLTRVDILVYRDSEEVADEFFFSFRRMIRLLDLDDKPYPEQVERAVHEAFQSGYLRVVTLLDNSPLISPKRLQHVFQQLTYEDDCIVVGPTEDGKCSLLGMKADYGKLFDSDNGDPTTKPNLLLQRICQLDAHLFMLPSVLATDTAAGLAQLQEEIRKETLASAEFPSQTSEVLQKIEKKYSKRKGAR
ncbi:MAG TPA: DUF2064 domain-containing protein [Bacteroidota bacterium]|nr:DUF2064 domain-containing protein [Bacteroidota bacterium]